MSYHQRMQMALAEAGYPDAQVRGTEDEPTVCINQVPALVLWRAFAICGIGQTPCFACWYYAPNDDDGSAACAARGRIVDTCGRHEVPLPTAAGMVRTNFVH